MTRVLTPLRSCPAVTQQWQYLMVWRHYKKRASHENYDQVVYRKLGPGDETPVELPKGTSLVALFNEHGADGWELVGSHMLNATIVAEFNGWPDTSIPVQERYVFKRPV